MNWRGIVVPISITSLVGILSATATVSNTISAHAELPGRVDTVEERQATTQDDISNMKQSIQGDIAEVKENVARVDGKVETTGELSMEDVSKLKEEIK